MSKTIETPQISLIDVLASGLDGPRKLNFSPDGALYVAEAGRGGTGASVPSPSQPDASLLYGATGAITRIQNGVAKRVVTGLPSRIAQVYRLNALGQPEVYAGGFTNIADLAFDKSGGLYVLEYDADGILNGSDAGALYYVSADGKTRTTLADDKLINPTGLALDSEGNIYISNKGFIAGQGEVLRLSLEKDTTFKPDSIYNQVKHYMVTLAADGFANFAEC